MAIVRGEMCEIVDTLAKKRLARETTFIEDRTQVRKIAISHIRIEPAGAMPGDWNGGWSSPRCLLQ